MPESQLYHTLFEHAPDAMILLNTKDFLDCNTAAIALFGYEDRAGLLGQDLMRLSAQQHEDDASSKQHVHTHMAYAFEHGFKQFTWLFQRVDGSIFDAEVRLTRYAHAGETSLQVMVRDISKLTALKEQVKVCTHHLEQEVARHRETRNQLRTCSLEDSLTNIGNRQYMIHRLNHAITLAERAKSSVALLCLDIDDFKSINSGIGYDIGDQVLIEVARRLTNTVRRSDSVGRLCGDEFAIMVEFSDDKKDALTIAHKVYQALAKPMVIQGHQIFVKVSTGISFFPEDSTDVMGLFQTSNFAMRKAAGSKHNTCVYSKAMYKELAHRFRLGNDLRHAIKNDELHLMLQPKVQLSTGDIIGAEALLRWDHPALGPISPIEFIPIAEKNGLIISIGDWVIQESCRIARNWKQAGVQYKRIAINISALQFEHDGFVLGVRQYIKDYGLSPTDIELEFTEGLAMKNPDQGIRILKQLSDMGLTIAIDDFGTGYSSLSYLKKLPINTLKIDRVFVKDICTDESDLILIELIISMAKLFKLTIVAEGAETAENVAFLEKLGCDIIQGYFYSPPVSENVLMAMLKKQPFKKITDSTR